jgi:hypothetical protein
VEAAVVLVPDTGVDVPESEVTAEVFAPAEPQEQSSAAAKTTDVNKAFFIMISNF